MTKTIKILMMLVIGACLLAPRLDAAGRGGGPKHGRGKHEKKHRKHEREHKAPQHDFNDDDSGRGYGKKHKKQHKKDHRAEHKAKRQGLKDRRPPGWSKGKKKGWKNDSPPGWSKWGEHKKESWHHDLEDSRRRSIERSARAGMSDEQGGEVADMLEKAIRHGYDARDALRTVTNVIDDVATEKLDSMDAIRTSLDTLLKPPRIKERIKEEEASRDTGKRSWFQKLLGN